MEKIIKLKVKCYKERISSLELRINNKSYDILNLKLALKSIISNLNELNKKNEKSENSNSLIEQLNSIQNIYLPINKTSLLDSLKYYSFHHICSFLEIKAIIKSRLISRKFNFFALKYLKYLLPMMMKNIEDEMSVISHANKDNEDFKALKSYRKFSNETSANHFSELTSFSKPPTLVKIVAEIILIFFEIPFDNSWIEFRKRKVEILQKFKNFNLEKLKFNQDLIQKVGEINALQLRAVSNAIYNYFLFIEHAIKAAKFWKYEKLEKEMENLTNLNINLSF